MQNEIGRQGNEEERRLQREVLAMVLVEHPVWRTLGELQRVIGRPAEVEAAVEALIAAGLLSRDSEDVKATPAALRFNEIEPIEPPREP